MKYYEINFSKQSEVDVWYMDSEKVLSDDQVKKQLADEFKSSNISADNLKYIEDIREVKPREFELYSGMES